MKRAHWVAVAVHGQVRGLWPLPAAPASPTKQGSSAQWAARLAAPIAGIVATQHTWENVVAACARRNHKKDDRSLREIGWVLHRVPFRSRGCTAWLMSIEPEPDWAPYLQVAG